MLEFETWCILYFNMYSAFRHFFLYFHAKFKRYICRPYEVNGEEDKRSNVAYKQELPLTYLLWKIALYALSVKIIYLENLMLTPMDCAMKTVV